MTDSETPSLTETSDSRAASEEATDAQESLSKDMLFELVRNQRRRDAISYLRACGGSTTLSDMSEHIAAKENGIDVAELTSKQRKRVYVGLYQCHLPKLSVSGVIDYDRDRGTIELNSLARELVPYLDESDHQWDVPTEEPVSVDGAEAPEHVGPMRDLADPVALGAAALGVVAFLGAVGAPVLATVPAAGWAAVSAASLVALAARTLLSR